MMFLSEKRSPLRAQILFVAAIAIHANNGFAQKVSKIIPDKGWVLVAIKDTSAVAAGQGACFKDAAGTSVACGKIVKRHSSFASSK